MSAPLNANDTFAPITAEELSRATYSYQPPANEDLAHVAPVPSNAPKPVFRHKEYGEANKTWIYHGPDGEVIGYVARFDLEDGSKQILPRTLWMGERGLYWRWKQWPEPRPIYGLDRLAQNLAAAVVIVEGEKCADAASKVFPASVVITSPGGSNAAKKVDWSPLKGRRVLIWPDADAAGSQYAAKTGRLALQAGASSVQVVDAFALGSAPVNGIGEGREAPDGWDVADAFAEGWNYDALRKAANAAAAPYEPGKSPMTWPFGYRLDNKGLWYDPGEDKTVIHLSGPFAVLGLARDPNGHGWAVALEWQDHDGVAHRAMIPYGDMLGDGMDVLRPLASGGLDLSHDPRRLKLFKAAIGGLRCQQRVRLVKRTGWRPDGVFVLPTAVIGNAATERVVFDGKADAAQYGTAGSLDEWVSRVAAPCAGNTRLVLALSIAFAGPLNDLLQGEGGGVHLVGNSSLGKSTALVAAGSVWGGGGRHGFGQSWKATGNALEGVARAHSGTVLVLDEIGELDAKEAGQVAYALVNGQGKARATRDADVRARAEWRVMLLSNGELGLADKIAESGRKARAGQLVRLVDVPADAGKGFGLFDDPKGMAPADFAERIKGDAFRTYGTAGLAFLEALANDPAFVAKEAREQINRATARMLKGSAGDGQSHRVAARFALIATAGEMARAALGLPWQEGEAERAASLCFDAWRANRGGDGPGELVSAITALREAVERHGESRFRKLGELAPIQTPIRDLLGYRTEREGALLWCFTSTGFKEVLSGIADHKGLARALAERGALFSTGTDRSGRHILKVDGQAVATYAVRATSLAGEA
jgi:putative DNA primase/helicase